jgi:hypothetical protein
MLTSAAAILECVRYIATFPKGKLNPRFAYFTSVSPFFAAIIQISQIPAPIQPPLGIL